MCVYTYTHTYMSVLMSVHAVFDPHCNLVRQYYKHHFTDE